jgi:alkylated DNA repair dioxygenase AlkB|tara:strand:- start:1721 stop:2302 length:582 start_codon:yes stop_codon:yes gene_type:complete
MKVFAKNVFKYMQPNIKHWDRPTIRHFDGKAVYGRPTKGYGTSEFNYAGKLYKPEPWTEDMELIKSKAEKWASEIMKKPIEFTFCLCGLYETGDDSIPHHSDTIPTLQDVVLGISFGGTRILEWNNYDKPIKSHTNTSQINLDNKGDPETTRFLVEEGDVYMFDGHSQMKATHSIPPLFGSKRRISLTFRSGL